MRPCNDLLQLEEQRDLAQQAANRTGEAQVVGYNNYSGWTFCDASDGMAVYELGDAHRVEPNV